jgi:heme/copper-type cytochrome/quinol oxidase subunit 2
MDNNKKKITIIIAIAIILIIGVISAIVIHRNISNNTNDDPTSENDNTADKHEDYLIITEWNLKFTIPETITDVQYRIVDDKAYFIAKPTGVDVKFVEDIESKFTEYSRVYLLRSEEDIEQFQSKKIDNLYYIIFGPENNTTGIFGDTDVDFQYENRVFFNGISMMLGTIRALE